MKYPFFVRFPVSFALGASLVLVSGCEGSGSAGGEEVRSVGTFTGVTNRSDADVKLVENTSGDGLDVGDVMVTCDAVVVATVSTELVDGSLVIDLADAASIFGCTITLVTDGVVDVVNDGDGDITCTDPLNDVRTIEVNGNGSIEMASLTADELNILVTGNGAVTIDEVTVDTLNIDLSGTGDATLGGTAGAVGLSISGDGSLWGKELVTSQLDAVLNGTGNASITVNGIVNAEVDGNVTLDVYGEAEAGVITEGDGGSVVFN